MNISNVCMCKYSGDFVDKRKKKSACTKGCHTWQQRAGSPSLEV